MTHNNDFSCRHEAEDGLPIQRPDRSTTETLPVTMAAAQANTIKIEAQVYGERALAVG